MRQDRGWSLGRDMAAHARAQVARHGRECKRKTWRMAWEKEDSVAGPRLAMEVGLRKDGARQVDQLDVREAKTSWEEPARCDLRGC